MNCYRHADIPAVAFCRSCGRPLCAMCQRPEAGTVFCEEHAPSPATAAGFDTATGAAAGSPGNPYASAATNPYMAPGNPVPLPGPISTSPGLAFLLGLIPGVGAIYNGQYVKGLVHAVIFGTLVSITNSYHESDNAFLVMCTMAFFCYMPFEAFHTARKRQMGVPVEEWSSLMGQNRFSSSIPVGPVLLIGVGVLFLMHSLHILDFRAIGRFWPVVLIVAGAIMLYTRLRPPVGQVPNAPAQPHFAENTRE